MENAEKKLRILFVEDQIATQMVVKHYFESLGHEVICVDDGIFALELLEKEDQHFDCIFMDIRMQIVDGITATHRIRTEDKYSRFKDVPIIAITAYINEISEQYCLERGMNGYISKPIDFRILKKIAYNLTGEKLEEK